MSRIKSRRQTWGQKFSKNCGIYHLQMQRYPLQLLTFLNLSQVRTPSHEQPSRQLLYKPLVLNKIQGISGRRGKK